MFPLVDLWIVSRSLPRLPRMPGRFSTWPAVASAARHAWTNRASTMVLVPTERPPRFPFRFAVPRPEQLEFFGDRYGSARRSNPPWSDWNRWAEFERRSISARCRKSPRCSTRGPGWPNGSPFWAIFCAIIRPMFTRRLARCSKPEAATRRPNISKPVIVWRLCGPSVSRFSIRPTCLSCRRCRRCQHWRRASGFDRLEPPAWLLHEFRQPARIIRDRDSGGIHAGRTARTASR